MAQATLPNDAYARLEARFRRIGLIGEAEAVLHWDHAAIMPAGGAEARAEQIAELRAVRHGMMTAPETADLISAADAEKSLDPWQQANLREIRRRHRRATALDERLVTALSHAESRCEQAWRKARPAGDFDLVRKPLKALVALVREQAEALSETLGLGLYDALLDGYEPNGRAAEIEPVFADLEAFLPGFLDDVLARQQAAGPILMPEGPFAEETQRGLGMEFMRILGFDFERGRLDVSHHPFCGGVPDDVRITTRYDSADFTSALMGVLHETGHALYEQGLPAKWRRQPVGDALGMSIHESQSLLMEMQVCRSPEFLGFAAPIMLKTFGGAGPAWTTENLLRLYHKVERSFIRVDADEVTYPLHVILRFRIERDVIEGRMEVDDIPARWNETFEKLVGIPVPDNRQGCLQDVHWYDGAWGYFPTYTLGAMTAAQLYRAARDAEPGIPAAVSKGDFTPLVRWLRDNVHAHGSSKSAKDLLIQATGKPLDADAFKAHLKARYLP